MSDDTDEVVRVCAPGVCPVCGKPLAPGRCELRQPNQLICRTIRTQGFRYRIVIPGKESAP